MRFVNMPENNLVLTAPKDWDEEKNGPCETVSVYRDNNSFTITMEFEPHEFAALLKGGKVKLRIFGDAFPPIALFVAET